MEKKSIAIIDNLGIYYDKHSKIVGGSETWTQQLSETFNKRGFDVTVFTSCNEPDLEGVHWYDIHSLYEVLQDVKFDFIIFTRKFVDLITGVRKLQVNAKIYLQLHDTVILDYDDARYVNYKSHVDKFRQLDGIAVLTEFHKNVIKVNHDIPEDLLYYASNGVDLDLFNGIDYGVNRDNRILFSSRPERGYDILAKLYPMIKERIPDFGIDIASYSSTDTKLFKGMDVRNLGQLSKSTLYSELSKHKVWFYPAIFAETFNISSLEAIMCGCMPVLPLVHAMGDTLKPFKFIGMDNKFHSNIDYVDANDDKALFESAVRIINELNLYQDPLRCKLRSGMREYIKNCLTWDNVVDSWIKIFKEHGRY